MVTGGTAGIGRAVSEGLAADGFNVIIVGHNPGRGERVARDIQDRTNRGHVEFEAADLSSLADARALGERLVRQHGRLDVVVHNFGGMYADRRVTGEGHEATLATNVLVPLRLTLELVPALRAAAPSRVVFVNSDAHKFAKPDLDDLEAERFTAASTCTPARNCSSFWSLDALVSGWPTAAYPCSWSTRVAPGPSRSRR